MIMRPSEISLVSEQLMTLYDDDEINRVEFQLLSKTCLIDEQLEIFDVLKDTKQDQQKQSLTQYRESVIAKLTELEEICGPLIDFLGDEKSVNELKIETKKERKRKTLFRFGRKKKKKESGS